uniref:Uncharacterized protein n=1 Tax=Rhabditophanes sp. KR3021 TaxID=114890 RepID=A0AC35UCD3_9BILA
MTLFGTLIKLFAPKENATYLEIEAHIIAGNTTIGSHNDSAFYDSCEEIDVPLEFLIEDQYIDDGFQDQYKYMNTGNNRCESSFNGTKELMFDISNDTSRVENNNRSITNCSQYGNWSSNSAARFLSLMKPAEDHQIAFGCEEDF